MSYTVTRGAKRPSMNRTTPASRPATSRWRQRLVGVLLTMLTLTGVGMITAPQVAHADLNPFDRESMCARQPAIVSVTGDRGSAMFIDRNQKPWETAANNNGADQGGTDPNTGAAKREFWGKSEARWSQNFTLWEVVGMGGTTFTTIPQGGGDGYDNPKKVDDWAGCNMFIPVWTTLANLMFWFTQFIVAAAIALRGFSTDPKPFLDLLEALVEPTRSIRTELWAGGAILMVMLSGFHVLSKAHSGPAALRKAVVAGLAGLVGLVLGAILVTEHIRAIPNPTYQNRYTVTGRPGYYWLAYETINANDKLNSMLGDVLLGKGGTDTTDVCWLPDDAHDRGRRIFDCALYRDLVLVPWMEGQFGDTSAPFDPKNSTWQFKGGGGKYKTGALKGDTRLIQLRAQAVTADDIANNTAKLDGGANNLDEKDLGHRAGVWNTVRSEMLVNHSDNYGAWVGDPGENRVIVALGALFGALLVGSVVILISLLVALWNSVLVVMFFLVVFAALAVVFGPTQRFARDFASTFVKGVVITAGAQFVGLLGYTLISRTMGLEGVNMGLKWVLMALLCAGIFKVLQMMKNDAFTPAAITGGRASSLDPGTMINKAGDAISTAPRKMRRAVRRTNRTMRAVNRSAPAQWARDHNVVAGAVAGAAASRRTRRGVFQQDKAEHTAKVKQGQAEKMREWREQNPGQRPFSQASQRRRALKETEQELKHEKPKYGDYRGESAVVLGTLGAAGAAAARTAVSGRDRAAQVAQQRAEARAQAGRGSRDARIAAHEEKQQKAAAVEAAQQQRAEARKADRERAEWLRSGAPDQWKGNKVPKQWLDGGMSEDRGVSFRSKDAARQKVSAQLAQQGLTTPTRAQQTEAVHQNVVRSGEQVRAARQSFQKAQAEYRAAAKDGKPTEQAVERVNAAHAELRSSVRTNRGFQSLMQDVQSGGTVVAPATRPRSTPVVDPRPQQRRPDVRVEIPDSPRGGGGTARVRAHETAAGVRTVTIPAPPSQQARPQPRPAPSRPASVKVDQVAAPQPRQPKVAPQPMVTPQPKAPQPTPVPRQPAAQPTVSQRQPKPAARPVAPQQPVQRPTRPQTGRKR